jgi:hypothetical protein
VRLVRKAAAWLFSSSRGRFRWPRPPGPPVVCLPARSFWGGDGDSGSRMERSLVGQGASVEAGVSGGG